jgi:hypothetical protein
VCLRTDCVNKGGGGKKPNWPQIPLSNTSKQNNPSLALTCSLPPARSFFKISIGAGALVEPGWRRVRACSLPVLHRNEALRSYVICPLCRLGTTATAARVQQTDHKLFAEATEKGPGGGEEWGTKLYDRLCNELDFDQGGPLP